LLGPDSSARVAADPSLSLAKRVFAKAAEVQKTCLKVAGMVDMTSLSAATKSMLSAVSDMVLRKGDQLVATAKEKIEKPYNEQGLTLLDGHGGSVGGKVWSEDLGAEETLAKVEKQAKKTLFKTDPVEFDKAARELEVTYKEYVSLNEFFGEDLAAKSKMESSRKVMERAFTTILEGILLFHFAEKTTPNVMKTNVTLALQKNNGYGQKEQMCPCIMKFVEKANLLRKL